MARLVADISKEEMDSAQGGSGSGDEETCGSQRGKKYHRHSAQQVEILEAFFKEVPHPDENQRQQLSRELGLDPKQIKFWFQNKRTQKKTQNEKADNNALRAENERILCENLAMQEALKNITCHSCNGPVIQDHNQQQDLINNLRTENSRLKEEHERTLRLFSDPIEILPAASRGIDQNNSYVPESSLPSNGMGTMTRFEAEQVPWNSENSPSPYCFGGIQEMDKAMIIDMAISAMNELIELLRVEEPVWISSSTDGRYVLHRDSYEKLFPKPHLFKSASARMESSKESGEVAMEAAQLVEMFRDPNKWKDMFPTIVTKARTFEALDKGTLLNSSLHLMYEKTHILSPLVAPREFYFLRCIQQLNAKTWVMVDVSYNFIKQLHDPAPTRTWKLPSGCSIEDKSNGRSFVDDKSSTHRLYRDLVCSCHAYGAKRWISTLQRMCNRFACSMGLIATPRHELEGVINSFEGRRNLMRLSHRMVQSFWEILSMSDRLDFPHMSELNNSGVRVSLRKSNGTGEPEGLIVCAATSLWLPFSIENLLSFFKDEEKRAQWDVLSGGNPVNAIARIPTGTVPENNISIIQPFVPKENLLMLQESSIDSLGALVIYSPTDLRSLTSVVNGNDTSALPILPSGYVISSDGRLDKGVHGSSSKLSTPGSLLTIAYQILVSSGSAPKQMNMESVAIVHSFISSTVQKIKEALGCGELD